MFLGDKDSGMVSTIADNVPNKFMSFKHLGEVKNGVENYENDWAGALENYTLNPSNGGTQLTLDIDLNDEFKDYFMNTFPAMHVWGDISENPSAGKHFHAGGVLATKAVKHDNCWRISEWIFRNVWRAGDGMNEMAKFARPEK